jgi:hypothetical protein
MGQHVTSDCRRYRIRIGRALVNAQLLLHVFQ